MKNTIFLWFQIQVEGDAMFKPVYRVSKIVQVDSVFSGFEARYDNRFRFDGERHEFWEFLYVLSGCIGVAVEDAVYELQPGNLILYAPSQFHSIWAAQGTEIHLIIMSFSLFGEDIGRLGGNVFKAGAEEDTLIRDALQSHVYAYHNHDRISNHLTANKIEELLLSLLRTKTPNVLQMQTKGADQYKTIIRVMNEHLCDNLSATQIADLCSLSLSNMKKIFTKYSRRSVMKYYNALRIVKAMDLITEGKTMAEISDILHFSSQHYFTEAFKRQSGMTPTEYKKKIFAD